ncbi:response regulator [Vibrio lentus]|uniref:response regulator n=1 Tax=Vibrio lentus TaxID=136468 RepID=UPI000C81E1B8|nr:response regulator [Vibrio lentus]PMN37180.1 hypothetical protein BCT33_04575 [Vibrio lentus]PMN63648.1 hypothetical protein BCT29_02105 [Vibrio lentus]
MPKMIPNFDQLSKSEKKESRIQLIMISFLLVFTLLVATAIGTWAGTNKVFEVLKRIHTTGELIFSLDRARLNTIGYVKDTSEKHLNEALNYIEEANRLTLDLNDHNEEKILKLIGEYRNSFLEYVEIDKERKAIIAEYAARSNLVNNNLKMVLNFNYTYRNPHTIELINSLISDKTAINKKIVNSLTLGRRLDTQQLNEAIGILKNIKSNLKELIPLIKNKDKSYSLSKLLEDTDFYIDIVTKLNKNNYALIKNSKEAIPSVLEAEAIILSIRDERINSVSDLKLTSYLITLLTLLFFIGMVMLAYLIYHSLKSLVRLTHEATLARDEAISSTKIKSQFLANMSHEIRTPLNAIIGMSQLATNTDIDIDKNKYIKNVNNASRSLLKIVNDILDTSKIESGSFNIKNKIFSLPSLIDEFYEMMFIIANEKGLNLKLSYSDSIPTYVLGDSLRLNQILLNIVGNAIKFTEKGEITLLISCDNLNKNKTKLSFEIIDTGIGISGEDIDKLFKPFSQVDESTSRMYGGTGLGLIISKQLVELMGGRLTVKSDQGKGSQFSFEIILDIAPEILDNQENQADVPKLNLKPLKNKHILLVEDNFINQELVKALLEGVTHLDVCSDGEKAIHQLSQQKYDGILMDCQLPQIDGYQATQMIRQELGLSLPIIAMTANIMSADIDKAIESGMNDIIGKPIDTQDMYRKMLKWFTNQIVETNDAGEVVTDKPVALIPSWLSKVSTLDLEAGLKIAAGNTALYLKLLSVFIEQYRGASIEANEHQKVHQLKGTAGNLGATALYQACVSHEERLEQESLIELNLKLTQLISDLMPLNDNQKSPSTQLSEEKMMETLIGHVLIVEDDLINQCLLKNQLKDLGLSSDVSNDGQHALTQLKERKGAYDLILTDIHMPNLDGHSLAREVKTNIGLYGYTNIVGCTGESNYTLENFEYFDALISKPIDSKTIYDNISKFLVKSEPLSTSEPESEIESNFSDYSNENKRDIYSVIIQSMSLDIESLDKSNVDLRALAHKIKGTANMLGLTEIATLAQELQNELDPQKIVSQKCMLTKKMNEIVEEVKDLLEGIE